LDNASETAEYINFIASDVGSRYKI